MDHKSNSPLLPSGQFLSHPNVHFSKDLSHTDARYDTKNITSHKWSKKWNTRLIENTFHVRKRAGIFSEDLQNQEMKKIYWDLNAERGLALWRLRWQELKCSARYKNSTRTKHCILLVYETNILEAKINSNICTPHLLPRKCHIYFLDGAQKGEGGQSNIWSLVGEGRVTTALGARLCKFNVQNWGRVKALWCKKIGGWG